MLGRALITLSVVIVLAVIAAAVYFAFAAPGAFFTLLALVAGYVGLAYWKAASEASRAADLEVESQKSKVPQTR